MADYSGTPLAKKLGIKSGHRAALINAPPHLEVLLEGLPPGVSLVGDLITHPSLDVVVLFAADAKQLRASFAASAKKLTPAGGLWVAWLKKASGRATDLSEDAVRDFGLAAGLVDNKVCAIDQSWSGLRFVVRVQDRPKTGLSGN